MISKSQAICTLGLLLIFPNTMLAMEHDADRIVKEKLLAEHKAILADFQTYQRKIIAGYQDAIKILVSRAKPTANIRNAQAVAEVLVPALEQVSKFEERCYAQITKLRDLGLITPAKHLADRTTLRHQHLEVHHLGSAYQMLLEQNQIAAERQRTAAALKIQAAVRRRTTLKASPVLI